jgi:2Fe-2S ferredoxin
MPKITYISATGIATTLNLEEGVSAMQGAVANSLDGIVGECGGSMMCATCHVYVDEMDVGRLPPPGAGEEEMLESAAAERRETSRLSCQIKTSAELDGLTLHMPDRQY